MSKYPGNKAGAAYSIGYCDAQCPREMNFSNGEANVFNRTKGSSASGVGKFVTSCAEMDVYCRRQTRRAPLRPRTPAPRAQGQHRSTGEECGSGAKRYDGMCMLLQYSTVYIYVYVYSTPLYR